MVTVIIIGRNDHKDGASFRKSFSVKEKRELVQAIELLMEEHKVNACQACLLIGVNQMYYTRFKRIIKKVDNTEFRDVFVPYKPNGSAWKIHPGGKSILNGVKDYLSHFVFETYSSASKSAPELCVRKHVDCFLSSGISRWRKRRRSSPVS